MRALLTIVAALALPATASAQTVSSPTVSELAGAARVAVTLVAARVDPVEIAWHTADATTLADAPLARAGVEYVPAAGVVRFEPGETVKEVLVTLLDDTVDEWSSFFAVVAGDASGFVQITDDDLSPAPSIADAVVKENAGAVTLTVTRPFATELGPMRYAWTVKPGSATGEVVFAPADTVKTFTVPIADDKTPEDDQTFTVELTPVGSEPPARAVATVTVVDDDSIVVRKSGRVLVGPDGTVVDVRRGEAEFRGATLSGAVFRVESSSLLAVTGACGKTLWVHASPGLRVRAGRLTTVAVSKTATWSLRDGCGTTVVRVLAGRVRVGSRVLRAGRRVTASRPSPGSQGTASRSP